MLDMLDKILELLENKDFPQLGNLLKDMNPADVAELFEDLPREKMALVFRLLPKELAADAFAYMNPDEQTVLVEAFSDKELHDVVNELYVDDAADMIEEMPANLVKRILRHTDAETRVLINQILNYPKDSAGSIMTMEYVDLKRGMTVEEAFDRIRAIGVEKETVYTCYVTDSTRSPRSRPRRVVRPPPPQAERHCDRERPAACPKKRADPQYHGNEHYLRFHPYR